MSPRSGLDERGKSRSHTEIRYSDRPVCSELLYRLSFYCKNFLCTDPTAAISPFLSLLTQVPTVMPVFFSMLTQVPVVMLIFVCLLTQLRNGTITLCVNQTVFSYTITYLSTDSTACSNATVFFLVTEIPAEMSQLNATIFMYFPTCPAFKFCFPITSVFNTVNIRDYKSCRIVLE